MMCTSETWLPYFNLDRNAYAVGTKIWHERQKQQIHTILWSPTLVEHKHLTDPDENGVVVSEQNLVHRQ